jgi:signal transduction histidine kinase/DNA-binding response OmpR family regulator
MTNHILVVDDNPTNIDVLFDYLDTAGFEVSAAEDGERAIELSQYEQPDLILLDVMMPGIDGFETCRRLKNLQNTKDIPIIFMTALTDVSEKVQGFEAGAVDYITKPVHCDEVLARVTTHLTVRSLQKQLESANAELAKANDELEQRVEDRTHRLQVIAELSEYLNEIHDLDKLLTGLVNQLQHSFDYYHVQIYLIRENSDQLVLSAWSSQLQVKDCYLTRGQGIIGTVIETNKPLLSNNVAETTLFVHSSLLPETKSELAVPLRRTVEMEINKPIGVLDIQSKYLNGFTSQDVSMIQSIADQAAVAIDNVRLLAERQSTIEKLRQFDKAKSEFMAMVSHELRTPLNAILGFSELLLLGCSGQLPDKANDDLALIKSSGEHLLSMINSILDITKLESGMGNITLNELDVKGVVHDVVAATEFYARGKPVKIVVDIAENLPQFQADHTRIHQILLNLLKNGIKFTKKGTVWLKAVISPDEPDMILFSVTDTGVGIPVEKQNLIFEIFSQADMSGTRQHEGVGLGLAICKLLVELQGGRIWVESLKGEGSTFYFTLPAVDGDTRKTD